MFGGASGFTPVSYNDTWVLEHANGLGGTPQWAQLAPSGGPPEARHGHSVGFAPSLNSIVITTGRHDVPAFHMMNDTWLLKLFTYDFSGFFRPVDNPPVENAAKAGQGIPVNFSLNGDHGLDIFATGYPKSQEITCDSSVEVDGIEETVSAGGGSLSSDSATDRYT